LGPAAALVPASVVATLTPLYERSRGCRSSWGAYRSGLAVAGKKPAERRRDKRHWFGSGVGFSNLLTLADGPSPRVRAVE
jgi:hypothetical protein